MTFVVIGGLLFLVGLVMTQDVLGAGTRWREVGMRFYDRKLGPDAHDKITRRFRLYYKALMVFGLALFVGGLLTL